MTAAVPAGVPISHEAGELIVEAKRSEVATAQLVLLRRHKAALLPLLAAFGTATVAIRPATPIPEEPQLGDWVWREVLHRRGSSPPEPAWTAYELERRHRVEAGETVLTDMHKGRDAALIAWAKRRGLFVRIDRDSVWGNQHVLPRHHTPEERAESIGLYRADILARPDLLARLSELRGRVLGCWCHRLPCHGDVLLELLARTS